MEDPILDNRIHTKCRNNRCLESVVAWLILWLLLVSTGGCEQKKTGNPQFTAGRTALMQGRYDESIEKLDAYLQAHPSGGLASRASFLIAKAHLGQGQLDKARDQFEHTVKTYGSSEEAHKSRYKLAVVSLLKGDRDDAKRRFQQLAGNPNGTLAPEAAAMLRFLEEKDGE